MTPADPAPNPATELAKERNRAAEERTLMAWVRTCLTLISFGFGIESIVAVLAENLEGAIDPLRMSRFLGLSFIALGTFAMLIAAFDHRYQLRRIQRGDLMYASRRSPTLLVAYILAALGSLAFFGILMAPFVS